MKAILILMVIIFTSCEKELVCTNTIQVPTFDNSVGLYLVSECTYDIQ